MVGVQWTSFLSQVRLVTSGKKGSNLTNKNTLIKIMEENHPYRSASGKVEIADVGCERMIIIKNYESLNYK